jgi:hypothetical protein
VSTVVHDEECQPTWATPCGASVSPAVLGCVGSVFQPLADFGEARIGAGFEYARAAGLCAFEAALRKLGLAESTDPATAVAELIIDFAKRASATPSALALQELSNQA